MSALDYYLDRVSHDPLHCMRTMGSPDCTCGAEARGRLLYELLMGPHRWTTLPDVRHMPYVVAYCDRYERMIYPMRSTIGEDAREAQDEADRMDRHFSHTMVET